MADRAFALFWALVAGLRLGLAAGGRPAVLPLALLSLLAAVRLVRRRPPRREAPLPRRLAAWTAAVLPWGAGLLPASASPAPLQTAGQILQALGAALALWALAALGEAFGIAPADRGLVAERGPYRLIRHPMYAGEILAFAGWLLERPSAEGAALLLACLLLAVLRIRWEEEVIEGYEGYARRVRWRLVPFIW
jgi:protein-S-isoprenylcysteine O-methyltransferase Ste14